MIPTAFDYHSPTTLDSAIELLQRHGDDAKILAGGHSLLPLMKLRLAAPAMLIDLARVPNLRYIRDAGDYLAIGAMTPYRDLEDSELLRRRSPLLAQAASMVGDAQVRNRGTLAGALAHADPAGDMPGVATALGGSVVASGPSGEREIPMEVFFQDIFTSALEPDEIVSEVRINASEGHAQNYQKFRRRLCDWAIVGVAVNIRASGPMVSAVRVVLTNVDRKPARAGAVEEALQGRELNAAVIREAAELADSDIEPMGELNAGAEYKRHLARVMTRRALLAACGLARNAEHDAP